LRRTPDPREVTVIGVLEALREEVRGGGKRGAVSVGAAVVAASALLLVSGPASSQPAHRIHVEVMVSHISERAGTIDARASTLHRKLRDQFRYESLRVLQTEQLALAVGEVATVKLPNGRRLRVRPLHVGDRGVLLMAVDLEGTLQTDLRLRSGQLVVIGAERYEDGKLVISLEPQF
jgi:hypothetical protein